MFIGMIMVLSSYFLGCLAEMFWLDFVWRRLVLYYGGADI